MPAKITIQSGISAGSSHWLDGRVVRIGSDPTADVCLPSADVAAHALTLEFRDGSYRIYNRSGQNVFVGTHVVAPDHVATWMDTDILQLGDEIQLVLDVGDDPAPSGKPTSARSQEWSPQDDGGGPTGALSSADHRHDLTSAVGNDPKSSSMWLQLAVIFVCVLGSLLLLARHQRKAGRASTPAPTFSQVIKEALASPSTSRELVGRLQYAESAVIRSDKRAAVARFERLRDDLLPQRGAFVANQRTPELAILDYVEFRLSRLEAKTW